MLSSPESMILIIWNLKSYFCFSCKLTNVEKYVGGAVDASSFASDKRNVRTLKILKSGYFKTTLLLYYLLKFLIPDSTLHVTEKK